MKRNKIITIALTGFLAIAANTAVVCAEEVDEPQAYIEEDIGAPASVLAISGDELLIEYSKNKASIVLYVELKEAKPFDIAMTFKLTNGTTKKYSAVGSGKDGVSYFPIQDPLDKLHIKEEDIDSVTLDSRAVKSVSWTKSSKPIVTPNAGGDHDPGNGDKNPATGLTIPLIPFVGGLACLILARKQKK